ncbi:hypothetical protein QWI17_13550 [Gilvimarinus sp. SDUM040013]|uniref:Uncharacterized protein n=1 Tax=Gilvimarinus gilvus TaxID=3058038 RepID=A0ABU4RTJ3_9GAMM|nr:hypothetical protein [Gilvimarinus sp. SDUM040013]MDO3386867.1 hypothetical protein [Gilvimarinus sp. SDUM040013]MDX6848203.1 hypothetical protein [Gilvimarinus sp. SDUM040013]
MFKNNAVLKWFTRVGAILIGAMAILLVPNLSVFDAELLPEIQTRTATLAEPDVAGNALSDVYGLASATGMDAAEVGSALLEALHAKKAGGLPASLTAQEAKTLNGGQNLDKAWQAKYPAASCNSRSNLDCFYELRAQITETPQLDARLLSQLNRYDLIISKEHFVEDVYVLDYTSPLPHYGLLMQLGRIRAIQEFQRFGFAGLVESSRIDMAFWRMVLADSQTVIGKMVAQAALRWHLYSLSHAINEEPVVGDQQRTHLRQILQPLSRDELDISEAFNAELLTVVENSDDFLKYLAAQSTLNGFLLSLMSQPVASVNLYYRSSLLPMYGVSKLSGRAFLAEAKRFRKNNKLSYLNPYNLGGRITLQNPWPLVDYLGRLHDLSGIYSLVSLQLEIKSSTASVQDAIAGSSFKNPYTEKPFSYDDVNHTLGFDCFNNRIVCEVVVR